MQNDPQQDRILRLRLLQLRESDALILAMANNFDVFNMTDVLLHSLVKGDLIFKPGEGKVRPLSLQPAHLGYASEPNRYRPRFSTPSKTQIKAQRSICTTRTLLWWPLRWSLPSHSQGLFPRSKTIRIRASARNKTAPYRGLRYRR